MLRNRERVDGWMLFFETNRKLGHWIALSNYKWVDVSVKKMVVHRIY